MANNEHLAQLKQGVGHWNQWRQENPRTVPDLSEANLFAEDLIEADLSRANLRGADLGGTYLSGANLVKADLSEAHLYGANLVWANLTEANLFEVDLRDASKAWPHTLCL
jgi:uncharacterized protein YjbI with pentapeptide repeats